MDYRKFLGREEELVLPYLGGAWVDAKDRRLRLQTAFEPLGWYRFSVKGRLATPKGAAEPPQLDAVPAVRGHFLSGRLVHERGIAEEVCFLPEEPARFAPLKARRWHSGALLFEQLEFEGEVENQVREALADGRSLEAVKGAGATLRAAFAYALLEAASRKSGVQFAPHEVRPHLSKVAQGGPEAAGAVLQNLEAERELAAREHAELLRRQQAALAAEELRRAREERLTAAQRVQRDHPAQWREVVHEKAEAALEAAGARLEQSRITGNRDLEVIFRFMDQRFISVVDALTFRVIDSGICLGHPPRDELLTLDSLCSVIREAIDDGLLVILRFP